MWNQRGISNRQALASVLKELLSYQVNNAGCMVNQREVTEEGLEKNFATNTLGKIVFNSSFSEIDEVLDRKRPLCYNLHITCIIRQIITTPQHPNNGLSFKGADRCFSTWWHKNKRETLLQMSLFQIDASVNTILTCLGRRRCYISGNCYGFSGTYILTTALMPALKKAEDPRVVGFLFDTQTNLFLIHMYCSFFFHAQREKLLTWFSIVFRGCSLKAVVWAKTWKLIMDQQFWLGKNLKSACLLRKGETFYQHAKCGLLFPRSLCRQVACSRRSSTWTTFNSRRARLMAPWPTHRTK